MPIINKRKLKNCTDKCGDCKHFKGERKFEDTCNNLGIIATSKAPTCYSPDLNTFRKISLLPELESLGKIIKTFSPKQARILASLLQKQSVLKERQFYFGQPLFINLGEDYLSHYFKAFLLDYDNESEYVLLVSRLKDCKTATKLMVPKDSVLNQLQFNERALELANLGRIVRDKKEFEHFRNLPIADKISKKGLIDVSKLIRLDLDVDVPTIDNAPKDVLEKKKKIKDLTEIFEETQGIVRVSKLKTKKEKVKS